jgi:hypothetical protein
MIIVRLTDGLGNQFFQYAAGRRLALQHETTLKLDTHFYLERGPRQFRLSHFNIKANAVDLLDMAKICPKETLLRGLIASVPGRMKHSFRVKLAHLGLRSPFVSRFQETVAISPPPPLMIGNVAAERFYHFDQDLLKCPDNIALAGYWQSEKYFSEISETIRAELTLIEQPDAQNQQILLDMAACESVSLHIRRGDKVNDGRFWASSREYCVKAMSIMQTKLRRPKFFVFTDDWAWVDVNIPATSDIIHIRNNQADYEDLRLMSCCKHNIVAPSSFSWWGAWLNRNPDKIVLRPQRWANFTNVDISDVFPLSWLVLE